MIADLQKQFAFTSQTNAEFETYSALNGRVSFLLKENPEKKIFHTVQVERNGFIHCLLFGTPEESKGYTYFRVTGLYGVDCRSEVVSHVD